MLANPNRGRIHYPDNVWSSYEYQSHLNIVVIIKVKILVLITWSYRSTNYVDY